MAKKTKTKLALIMNILPWAIITGIIGGYFAFGLPVEDKIVTKEKVVTEEKIITVKVDDSLQEKIEVMKETLLDDLRTAEVQGYEHLEVIMVFDPLQKDLNTCRQVGGVRLHCYSFGDYNFKIATVQHFYNQFYGYTPGEKEALDIALDKELSRSLAKKIIFDEVGGIWHWKNSADKIDAKKRIEFIRQLES